LNVPDQFVFPKSRRVYIDTENHSTSWGMSWEMVNDKKEQLTVLSMSFSNPIYGRDKFFLTTDYQMLGMSAYKAWKEMMNLNKR